MHTLSLLYHRINMLRPDPWTLCVSPAHFAEQMDVASRFSPRPIITFDDGYADNLHQALPILERFNIPARFFVVSGELGSLQEMWWDALDQVFDPAHKESSNRYSDAFTHLRSLPSSARLQELNKLFSQESRTRLFRQNRRMMTPDELSELSSNPLVEIGAHTVSHPVLSLLNLAEQVEEVGSSKRQLEEIIGKVIAGFAYPNGMLSDYTTETVEAVQHVGFKYAYSAFEHDLGGEFQLPRVMIRDWDGEQFSKVLHAASNKAAASPFTSEISACN